MAFDPDQYLAGASGGFDPDAYLGEKPDNAGTLANIGLGALRGASNIGRTLMMPVDYASDVISGNQGSSIDQRKAALDEFFKNYADPESIAFRGGELATEIAGTAGVGSGLAVGAKAAGMSPAVVAALESGGLSLGNAVATTGREMLKNAATRVGAGAVVGGASAGVINPSAGDIGTGAAIGGALPVAVRVGGELGKMAKAAIYDPIANKDKIIGGLLSRTVGQNAPATLQIPATPGVRFSASESTGNQGLAALEDTLRAVNPSGSLAAQSQSNRTALADTMRGMAKDESAIKAAETARSAATSPIQTWTCCSPCQSGIQQTGDSGWRRRSAGPCATRPGSTPTRSRPSSTPTPSSRRSRGARRCAASPAPVRPDPRGERGRRRRARCAARRSTPARSGRPA